MNYEIEPIHLDEIPIGHLKRCEMGVITHDPNLKYVGNIVIRLKSGDIVNISMAEHWISCNLTNNFNSSFKVRLIKEGEKITIVGK